MGNHYFALQRSNNSNSNTLCAWFVLCSSPPLSPNSFWSAFTAPAGIWRDCRANGPFWAHFKGLFKLYNKGPGTSGFNEAGVRYDPYRISRKSRLKLGHFFDHFFAGENATRRFEPQARDRSRVCAITMCTHPTHVPTR